MYTMLTNFFLGAAAAQPIVPTAPTAWAIPNMPQVRTQPASPYIPHILPQWPELHGTPRRAPVVAAQFTDPSVHWPVRYTKMSSQKHGELIKDPKLH
eukprot:363605-Chlamydomonas_euryale.AAC.7